jgi:subtilisin family serine protease
MKSRLKLILFIFVTIFVINRTSFSQVTNFKHDFLLENVDEESQLAISLAKTPEVLSYAYENRLTIRKTTDNWVFMTISGWELKQLLSSPISTFLYTEINEPVLLNDTSRLYHQVNEVQNGQNKLPSKYTGKGVLLGFIDTGLDFTHPDFQDSTGKTRVLSYWDQSKNYATAKSPKPFNYGEHWSSSEIDNDQCTAVDNVGHGTHVVGIAAGNGLANGKHKGMAPDASIVMVKTNTSAKNWTLTVADACDYIFKIADQLDKPCVINISYGVAMGSHDGNDPASEQIESLLDEKPGRVVVAAAGNNGNLGKYHLHGDVDSDTSFFWTKSTPKGIAGSNSIYLGIWSDSLQIKDVSFSVGANLPSGNFKLSGKTPFRTFAEALKFSPNALRDTIFNENGVKLAFVDYYAEIINHSYHLEVAYTGIDSTNYLFQFMTKGSGSFDVWGGSANKVGNNNFNDFIVDNLPNNSIYPAIANYMFADSLQTVFSSYISSEKVMTVGNISTKASYRTKDQIIHLSDYKSGELSISSSKGPNRKGLIKPDIVASGTKIFSANPLKIVQNSANNSILDEGGFHALNSGTSMASPLVAGIAALYLEKCSNSSYLDFKNDVVATAKKSTIQGKVPNNAYGNGEINALSLLLLTTPKVTVLGNTLISCSDSTQLTLTSEKGINSIIWLDSTKKLTKTFRIAGKYPFQIRDTKNCLLKDTIDIQSRLTPIPIGISRDTSNKDSLKITCLTKKVQVVANGGVSYLWTGGDVLQNDTVNIYSSGTYQVEITDSYGCVKRDSIKIFQDTIKPKLILEAKEGYTFNCTQKSLSLHVSGATNYRWDNGLFGSVIDSSYSQIGKHTISGKGINGCIAVDTFEFVIDTVKPKLALSYIGDSLLTCINKSVRLSYTGAASYVWSGGTLYNSNVQEFGEKGVYTCVFKGFNGCENSVTIYIQKDSVIPTITKSFSSPSIITCLTKSVAVNLTGATTYQWDGGSSITSASNTFKLPGIYHFIANNSNGCLVSDSVEILSDTIPIKSSILVKGLNKLTCVNKRVSLQVTGGIMYSWNGGTPVSTDTNSFTSGGNYSVVINDSKGCSSQQNIYIPEDTTSPEIVINLLSSPFITCDNEPVKVKLIGANTYTWNGGSYLNKDSNTFSLPGTYRVTAVGLNGCVSKDSIVVERHFYPATPTITQTDKLLVASVSPNYQWYSEGNLLKDETKQSIVFEFDKTYFVSVESNGCITSSKFYTPQLSGINNNVLATIQAYPNPTNTGAFSLVGLHENDELSAFDMLGNKIVVEKDGTQNYRLVDVSSGVYLLSITRNSERMLVKIIKN